MSKSRVEIIEYTNIYHLQFFIVSKFDIYKTRNAQMQLFNFLQIIFFTDINDLSYSLHHHHDYVVTSIYQKFMYRTMIFGMMSKRPGLMSTDEAKLLKTQQFKEISYAILHVLQI